MILIEGPDDLEYERVVGAEYERVDDDLGEDLNEEPPERPPDCNACEISGEFKKNKPARTPGINALGLNFCSEFCIFNVDIFLLLFKWNDPTTVNNTNKVNNFIIFNSFSY